MNEVVESDRKAVRVGLRYPIGLALCVASFLLVLVVSWMTRLSDPNPMARDLALQPLNIAIAVVLLVLACSAALRQSVGVAMLTAWYVCVAVFHSLELITVLTQTGFGPSFNLTLPLVALEM